MIMWYFHADHHKKDHKSWFERNDLFFIIYAVPSWLLIMFGMMNQLPGIHGWVLVFYL
jgi:beta-carotene 3-hydroxylase